jgi:hypothetical protein
LLHFAQQRIVEAMPGFAGMQVADFSCCLTATVAQQTQL